MIVYISTERNSQLFQNADVLSKTYIKWRYDVGNFIKEEYEKILSVHPDAIVVDYMAVDDIDDLTIMNTAFKGVKLFLVTDVEIEDKIKVIEGWNIITWSHDTKDKILNLIYSRKADSNAKEVKIGVISDKDDAKIEVAFNLLETILKYVQNVCLIEVSEKSQMANYVEKFGLIKKNEFYEYKKIPILHNMAKSDVEISIFCFDCNNRNMFEKCDYPIELQEELLIYENNAFLYPKLKDPLHDDRTSVYKRIFGDKLGFEFDKVKPETENEVIKEKKNNESERKIRNIIYGILIFSFTILLILLLSFSCSKVSDTNDINATREASNELSKIESTSLSETTTQLETTFLEETASVKETTTRTEGRTKSETEKVTAKKKEKITSKKVQTTTKAEKQNTNSETKKDSKSKKTAKSNGNNEKSTKKDNSKDKITTTQPFNIKYKVD